MARVIVTPKPVVNDPQGLTVKQGLATLGFRGEALPSIASVSRFTLTTCDGSADAAIEIECDPLTGTRTSRPAARDRGTTISVRELFENVPARR